YRTDSLRRDLQAFRNLFENAPIGLMEDHLRHILEFDSELLHHLPQSFFQTADCLTKERGPVHVQGMALCFDRLLRRRGSRASSWKSKVSQAGPRQKGASPEGPPPGMAAISPPWEHYAPTPIPKQERRVGFCSLKGPSFPPRSPQKTVLELPPSNQGIRH